MNLKNTTKQADLSALIGKMEQNNDSNFMMNHTIIYINELQELESLYLQSGKTIDLIPHYKSFLKRLTESAKSEQLIEAQQAQMYAITAALSKLCLLNRFKNGEIILNINEYLEHILKSIDKFTEANYGDSVYKNFYNYQVFLSNKMHSTHDVIMGKLIPEIDNTSQSVNENIEKLMENNAMSKNKNALLESKRNWQRTLLFLQFASTTLSVVGFELNNELDNRGSEIHSLIANLNSFATVKELCNNITKQSIDDLKKSSELVSTAFINLKTTKSEKFIEFQKYESDINSLDNTKLNIIARNQNLSERIGNLKRNMNGLIVSLIISEYRKASGEWQNARDKQQKEQGLEMLSSALETLNGIGVDKNRVLNSRQNNTQNSQKQLENALFSKLYPVIYQIQKMVYFINGLTSVKLYMLKDFRSNFNDAKSILQEMINGMSPQMQQQFQHCFDKLNDGFATMISIYDRIDSYLDSKELFNYFGKISLTDKTDDGVTHTALKAAISDLRLKIKSNLLLEKYGNALYAYKQHNFPFVAELLNQFDLAPHMQHNDIQSMKSNAIRYIKGMQNSLQLNQMNVSKYSKYIHTNEKFNSNTKDSTPFYVWSGNQFANDFEKLLSGTEIELKADIRKGLSHNAVKYNDIGIHIKFRNDTKQMEFDAIIPNFRLTMNTTGHNYYRCNDQFYYIPMEDQVSFSYTLRRDQNKWTNPNEHYNLIKTNHAFLSPYVMWSIKLTREKDGISFDSFQNFDYENIDLELVGEGSYVENDVELKLEVCNKNLEMFYNVDTLTHPIKGNGTKPLSIDVQSKKN